MLRKLCKPVVFAVRRSHYEGRDIRQVVDPRRSLVLAYEVSWRADNIDFRRLMSRQGWLADRRRRRRACGSDQEA